MLGLLAVALNLEGWRGPVVFLVVGIAGIVVFMRVLEWGSNGLKARARRKAMAPAEPEAYGSYDERRAALSEGENLDDWLDRVRVTPEDRKIKPHSRYWIYKAGDHPDVLFLYYRVNPGGRLLRHVATASQDFHNFETESPHKMVCRSFEGLSVAFPTSGEWWAKVFCAKHPQVAEPRIVTREDGWFFYPERKEELLCGCLEPVNFGKGYPKPMAAPGAPHLRPVILDGKPVETGYAGNLDDGGDIFKVINTVIKESGGRIAKVLELRMQARPDCPSCLGKGYMDAKRSVRCLACFPNESG